MAPNTHAPGWRDVLDLQKDTMAALESHREDSGREHREIGRRLDNLEDKGLLAQGQKAGETRVFGIAKSTLALIVSIAVAVATFLHPTVPPNH